MADRPDTHSETPADITALLEEAVALHGQGALDLAAARYQRVLDLAPEDFNASLCLGILRNQREEYAAALPLLDQAVRLNPRSAPAHVNMGLALWKLQRPEDALAHYQYSLALKPASPEALLSCALILAELGRPDEALAKLDKITLLYPDAPEGHLQRGKVLLELRRLEEALASLDRAIALRPDLAEAHFIRGQVLSAGGGRKQLAAAVISFERGLSFDPRNGEAFVHRGNALLALGRPEEALGSFERALACTPEDPEAALRRGSVLLGLKRFSEALASLALALHFRPDHPETLLTRGRVLLELHRFPEAQDSFDRAFAAPLPEHTLLRLQAEHETALAEAFYRFRQGAQAPPSDPWRERLLELGTRHATDKVLQHGYHRFYPPFIDCMRDREPAGLLEIGLYRGASLKLWLDYFPTAHIYGFDIEHCDQQERVTVVQGDQSRPEDLQRLLAAIRHPIYVINDDGSHIPEHQILTFNTLFPALLEEGGAYLIEDIETSYWSRGGLYGYETHYGFNHPDSLIEKFKLVLDYLNREFLTAENLHLLRSQLHRAGFASAALDAIGSVTLGPNCVIILKALAEDSHYSQRPYRFEAFL